MPPKPPWRDELPDAQESRGRVSRDNRSARRAADAAAESAGVVPSRAAVFGALAAIDAARQSTLEEAEGVGSERRQAKRTFEDAGGAASSAVYASSAELAA